MRTQAELNDIVAWGERLELDGFDLCEYDEEGKSYSVRCSQCNALVINGISTHELGCPNARRAREAKAEIEAECDAIDAEADAEWDAEFDAEGED